MELIGKWKQQLHMSTKRQVVFTEPFDLRVLQAAVNLAEEELLTPVLLGNKEEITAFAAANSLSITNCICLGLEEALMGLPESIDAGKLTPNLAGILLLKNRQVDACITGATISTSTAIRPALQHLPFIRENSRISGAMVVEQGERKMIFADCSIHIEPTAEALYDIAVESIETAKKLQIEPRIAFISYTSKSKRTDLLAGRIKQAISWTKASYPDLAIDGELQFDTAYNPAISLRKAPHSVIQGDASIFIFPNLEAGNLACKMIEQLTTCATLGPITQGFAYPFHDLSRGCTSETVYHLAIYAAIQANDSSPTT